MKKARTSTNEVRSKTAIELKEQLSILPLDCVKCVLEYMPFHFSTYPNAIPDSKTTMVEFTTSRCSKQFLVKPFSTEFLRLFFGKFKHDEYRGPFFVFGTVIYTAMDLDWSLVPFLMNCTRFVLEATAGVLHQLLPHLHKAKHLVRCQIITVPDHGSFTPLNYDKLPECMQSFTFKTVNRAFSSSLSTSSAPEFWTSLTKGHALKHLDVAGIQLNDEDMAAMLTHSSQRITSLGLYPSTNKFATTFAPIVSFKLLTQLKIYLDTGKIDDLLRIVTTLPRLRMLSVLGRTKPSNTYNTDYAIHSALQVDELPDLENNQVLEYLYLPHCVLTPIIVEKLTRSNIKRFSIATPLDDREGLSLLKQLVKNATRLSALKVTCATPKSIDFWKSLDQESNGQIKEMAISLYYSMDLEVKGYTIPKTSKFTLSVMVTNDVEFMQSNKMR